MSLSVGERSVIDLKAALEMQSHLVRGAVVVENKLR